MLTLTVPDMHCGGCATSVRKAIQSVDPAAQVQIDLERKQVAVQTTATPLQVRAAVESAGFEAAPVP